MFTYTEAESTQRNLQAKYRVCFWDPPSPPERREHAMFWACNGRDDTPCCAESSLRRVPVCGIRAALLSSRRPCQGVMRHNFLKSTSAECRGCYLARDADKKGVRHERDECGRRPGRDVACHGVHSQETEGRRCYQRITCRRRQSSCEGSDDADNRRSRTSDRLERSVTNTVEKAVTNAGEQSFCRTYQGSAREDDGVGVGNAAAVATL